MPYFFGICCFAFEGNTVTLEIYSKMQHKKRNFTKALALGIGGACFLFMMTGILFYNAYGQFTQPHFIGNLEPTSFKTYLVKVLYAIGVTSGYILQIAPLFNLFDKYLFSDSINGDLDEMRRTDPEKAQRLYYWSLVLRGALAIFTCLLGFMAGDFSTFLNLQGALVGTLISYILPCLFFLRMTTYVRAMRYKERVLSSDKNSPVISKERPHKPGKMARDATDKDRGFDQDDDELMGEADAATDSDEKQSLLIEELSDEDLDKEPAHIHIDKLAEETKIERLQRYVCYLMITYGFVGGFISFLLTCTTILQDILSTE